MKTLLLCLILSTGAWVGPAKASAADLDKETKCLAETMYYEARGEPIAGIIEVGNVVLNRVKDRRWPGTVCGVVYQPWQFEWTAVVKNRRKANKLAWAQIKLLAQMMMKPDRYMFQNSGSTHYVHKRLHLRVWWTKKLRVSHRIGNHVFYY